MVKNFVGEVYTYVITESVSRIEECDVIQYGISMKLLDKEVATVDNISEEYLLVEKLAQILTEEQIDTISLEYIVEDFIAESYTYY